MRAHSRRTVAVLITALLGWSSAGFAAFASVAEAAGGTGPVGSLLLVESPGPLGNVGGNARGGFRVAVQNDTGTIATSVSVTLTPPGSLALIADAPVIDAAGWNCGAPATDRSVLCTLTSLDVGATSAPIVYTQRLRSVWGEPSHVGTWQLSYGTPGSQVTISRPPGWRFEATTPANDAVANAVALTGTTGEIATATWGSTVVPGGGAGEDGHGSVWYRIAPACAGRVTITTTNQAGSIPFWSTPKLEIFSGTPALGLTPVTESYQQFSSSQSAGFDANGTDVFYVSLVSKWLDPTTIADGPYTYGDFVGRQDLSLGWSTQCTGLTLAGDRAPSASGWYTAPVTVQAASAADAIEIGSTGADSHPATTGPSPQTLSISVDGATDVTATELVNGVPGETKSLTIRVDKTAPTVTITSPANGATFAASDTPHATYTCNDVTSGPATCDGPVPSGAAIDMTPGDHTFSVTANDVAGNPASASATYHVNAPVNLTLSLTPDRPVPAGGWYNAPVTVTALAPAPAQAVTLTVAPPSGFGAAHTVVSPTPPQVARATADTDGTWTFTAVASAGAVDTPMQTLRVSIDTVAPTAHLDQPRPALTETYRKGEVVKVGYQCFDDRSGIASCVGNQPTGSNLDTSATGTHTFEVRATDLAGNVATTRATYVVIPGDDMTVAVVSSSRSFTRTGTAIAGDIVVTRSGGQITGINGAVTLPSDTTVSIVCTPQRTLFSCAVTVRDQPPGAAVRAYTASSVVPVLATGNRYALAVTGGTGTNRVAIVVTLIDRT